MKIELSERRQRHVVGILLCAIALLTLASLVTYRAPGAGDPIWATGNASGPLGAWLAHALMRGLGSVVAVGVPLALGLWGVNRLRGQAPHALALESAFGSLLALE